MDRDVVDLAVVAVHLMPEVQPRDATALIPLGAVQQVPVLPEGPVHALEARLFPTGQESQEGKGKAHARVIVARPGALREPIDPPRASLTFAAMTSDFEAAVDGQVRRHKAQAEAEAAAIRDHVLDASYGPVVTTFAFAHLHYAMTAGAAVLMKRGIRGL